MYKFKLAFITAIGCLLMSQGAMAGSLKEIAPYPQAEKGYVRQAIFLPALENENNAKVELVIGKVIEVDCNSHFFGGKLEQKDLQGWGYTYWVLDELKGPFGTLMACPNNKLTKKFVSLNTTELQRYNSKLPIVVYVPAGVHVKYRIWQAGGELKDAQVK